MFRTLTLLIFIVITFSCGSRQAREHKVLRYNQPNHITSLDPAFAKSQNNIWSVLHLFDGLVELDDSLNVSPAIAKSWLISEDGLDYTFYLREDVYFHENDCFSNGSRKVVASDFEYSLTRLIDSKISSPGSWLFTDKIREKRPFEAIDDTTFVLHLTRPFIPMLGILTMQYCAVVPQEGITYYGSDFAQNPVGTGAFKFKKWIANQALFLNRNDNYYKGPSKLEGIKTSFMADKKIAMLELLNGNIDFVNGLESSFINELLDKNGVLLSEKENQLKLSKSPYLNSEYLGINLEDCSPNSPLRIKEVRQAINYAIDRKLMLTALRNNVGQPADSGFVPTGLPSHDKESVPGYEYNLQKAKTLLLEAGYPDGNGLEAIALYTNKDYLDITTFVARQLQKIGLLVTIEVLESAILRDGMRKGSIPFFRGSWIADYPDAESFLCMYYSKNPAPPNYTRFSNENFDNLYEQSIKETDITKRYELYQTMDRILVDEAPVIFLFYDEASRFHSPQLKGVSENGLNLLKAWQLELDDISPSLPNK